MAFRWNKTDLRQFRLPYIPFQVCSRHEYTGSTTCGGLQLPLLRNAPAHSLFDRIKVQRKDGVEVARSFQDYNVTVNDQDLPSGVTLLNKVA